MTEKPAWRELARHQKTLDSVSLKTLFEEHSERFDEFSIEMEDLLFDFSKQRIRKESIEKLCRLAEESHLEEHRAALFSGEKINLSENRAVLHTVLRNASQPPFLWEGEDLKHKVQQVLQKMSAFSLALHNQQKMGISGKPFTDILCLGIGGSELGPALVAEAFSTLKEPFFKLHFISNIDGKTLEKTLSNLNPHTTLCIISSKTFTTPETLINASAVSHWYRSHFAEQFSETEFLAAHFLAVTANKARAISFGIAPEHIFEFWEWVGGRYSIWSAVGLPIVLAFGFPYFEDLLQGAREMDQHFLEAPFSKNMPILLALLGIWNSNFWGCHTQAILPYEDALRLLPSYLQQLEMESNGKSVTRYGEYCGSSTAPIIFGGIGCNGQHAYMQLLHQSNQIIPVDFWVSAESYSPFTEHHELLVASCLSQSKALMEGQSEDNLEKQCPGNRPSNTFMYSKLTPKLLGKLLALYEHKVFVQGVIWGINSFDQWGVELGKKLSQSILPALKEPEKNDSHLMLDSSTRGLIKFFRRKNQETE